MSVGNQTSVSQVNQQLSNFAVQIRNDMQSVQTWAQFVVNQGTAGLEVIGYDSADAATLVTLADYFLNIAGVFFGTATQASAFNYENALLPYTAGN